MATRDNPRQGLCAPWCLIESEPAIFAAMADMYGVKGVEFKEIYMIDDLLQSSTPVYGLIMSYAIGSEAPEAVDNEILDSDAESLFFSCQVVTNVCATSALLGVILNIDDKDLVIGEELKQFRKFTEGFSPVDRGMAIANSDLLKRTHNTFSNFESKRDAINYPRFEDFKPNKRQKHYNHDEPDYHFVAFIPANGYIWELDGFYKAPIKLDAITSDWIEQVVTYLKDRMGRSGSIDFSLLSINKSSTHINAVPGHLAPPSSTSGNPAELYQRQSSDKLARMDSEIFFYEELIRKVEGYLDAKFYNWGDDSLKILDENCDMAKHCDAFVTGQSKWAHIDLLDATRRRADLFGQLNLRGQAILMRNKLIKERYDNYTQPKKDKTEANIGVENITIGPKELNRRQHNYELLITTTFAKLHEENLLFNS